MMRWALLAVLALQIPFPYGQQSYEKYERPEGYHDDGWAFCRLSFTKDRSEPMGNGWATDFPRADINFTRRIGELTTVRVVPGEQSWVVSPTDPDLFRCPFLMASDVGTMSLSGDEALALRDYFAKGGFLWVDDFWGTVSWDQWLREMRKIDPGLTIKTPSFEHPIYHTMYRITRTLQVTNQPHWTGTGSVQEQGEDSPLTPLQVAETPSGHIAMVMTHNSDIADIWEQEARDSTFDMEFAVEGYTLGINVLLYTLTH